MGPHLETVFADVTKLKRRSLEWTLIHYAWCPHKPREGGHTCTAVMADVETGVCTPMHTEGAGQYPPLGGQEVPLPVVSVGLAPQAPWFWTSGLQNCETTRFRSGTPSVVTGYSSPRS